MTRRARPFIAAILMSVGLISIVADSVANGLSTLSAVGAACLVLAIATQILLLRRAKPHH
jgi:membrane-bound ClpP family serine protease